MPLPTALLLSAVLAAAQAPPTPAPRTSAPPMSGPMAPMAAETCPAVLPALPPAMAGWSARTPLAAAASPAGLAPATLAAGRGVDASLRPAEAVSYAVAPGRPAGPGARAGLLALAVAEPGTYAVGLSSAAWIDVVDARGAPVASTAHGRGPPCSGMRKVVDFPLAAGRYVVQLTTAADPVVGVLAFRR